MGNLKTNPATAWGPGGGCALVSDRSRPETSSVPPAPSLRFSAQNRPQGHIGRGGDHSRRLHRLFSLEGKQSARGKAVQLTQGSVSQETGTKWGDFPGRCHKKEPASSSGQLGGQK